MLIKYSPPSDRKEYHRVCKEWDNLNEIPKSRKSYLKGTIILISFLLIMVGFSYALSRAKLQNKEQGNDYLNPYAYGSEPYIDETYMDDPYLYGTYLQDPDLFNNYSGEAVAETTVSDPLGTYDSTYDGIQMSQFVNGIYDFLKQNTQCYNIVVETTLKKEDNTKVLESWLLLLDTYEQSIQTQIHHSSFDSAYEQTLNLITYCRERITNQNFLEDGTTLAIYNQVNSIEQSICDAFDLNEIRYLMKENGDIQYWYHMK